MQRRLELLRSGYMGIIFYFYCRKEQECDEKVQNVARTETAAL